MRCIALVLLTTLLLVSTFTTIAQTPPPPQPSATPLPVSALDTLRDVLCCYNALLFGIEAEGLFEVIRGEGPFTIFAVANESMASLQYELLTALNTPASLGAFARYHIVPGEYSFSDLQNVETLTTLLGQDLYVSQDENGQILLNNSVRFVGTDIAASNGVIHVIDRPLIPLTMEAPDAAEAARIRFANFSNFDSVNFVLNNDLPESAQVLARGTVSGWLEVPPGLHRVGVGPGEGPQLSIAGPTDYLLTGGSETTVAIVGAQAEGYSTTRLQALQPSSDPIGSGSARASFFYTPEETPGERPSVETPAVSVLVDGALMVDMLTTPEIPGPLPREQWGALEPAFLISESTILPPPVNNGRAEIQLPAGTHTVQIVPVGAAEPVLAEAQITLEADADTFIAVVDMGDTLSIVTAGENMPQ